jgi:hypothetical protein
MVGFPNRFNVHFVAGGSGKILNLLYGFICPVFKAKQTGVFFGTYGLKYLRDGQACVIVNTYLRPGSLGV